MHQPCVPFQQGLACGVIVQHTVYCTAVMPGHPAEFRAAEQLEKTCVGGGQAPPSRCAPIQSYVPPSSTPRGRPASKSTESESTGGKGGQEEVEEAPASPGSKALKAHGHPKQHPKQAQSRGGGRLGWSPTKTKKEKGVGVKHACPATARQGGIPGPAGKARRASASAPKRVCTGPASQRLGPEVGRRRGVQGRQGRRRNETRRESWRAGNTRWVGEK